MSRAFNLFSVFLVAMTLGACAHTCPGDRATASDDKVEAYRPETITDTRVQ